TQNFNPQISDADDIAKNQALSKARADAVFNYLTTTGGVSASQLVNVAFGETKGSSHWQTTVTGDNTENQSNRRVTLTLDRVIYVSNVNVFNDPQGTGLDGADTDYEIPAQPERGIWMGLSLDVDKSGGAKQGRIYLAFADQSDLDGNSATAHHDTDI